MPKLSSLKLHNTYYAVWGGKNGSSIKQTWTDAEKEIRGVKGCKHKKFSKLHQAEEFIRMQELNKKVIETRSSEVNEKGMNVFPSENEIHVYTDGSTRFNGSDNAMGGIGVWFGEDNCLNLSEIVDGGKVTNQRCELTAVIRSIEIVSSNHDVSDSGVDENKKKLIVFTDSMYVVSGMNDYIPNIWSKNDWHNNTVANLDLWKRLLELHNKRGNIEYMWVKGHASNYGNIGADLLARTACDPKK